MTDIFILAAIVIVLGLTSKILEVLGKPTLAKIPMGLAALSFAVYCYITFSPYVSLEPIPGF